MTTREIVAKLWNMCNVLRDGGISYLQYITELTYILFLKMAKEKGAEAAIPVEYRWDSIACKSGLALKRHYKKALAELGDNGKGRIREIYQGATSNIDEPANLETIIGNINKLDWYSAKEESFGDLYEGLMEKTANERISGAGQYFTPRPLIDVMVSLMKPKAGELCNDPACGTFGFMIAADQYVRSKTDDYFDLTLEQQKFQNEQAFTGCEYVHDAHRLALMNAMLHGIEGKIYLGDTLSTLGKGMNGYDLVLTNPPFGTKKGGESASRDDFTISTSNKQLNFLQHIYRSLKPGGRAAVVLPDNVLFADGAGQRVRQEFMDKCNLHTILRLPTGIFYSPGVKTNVLFFSRGKSDKNNTKDVWFYDMRTNMPSFGKTNPLQKEHFANFEKAYNAKNRYEVEDERWHKFTREEIAARNDSLDLGLIRDESVLEAADLPDPITSGEECIALLEEATDLMQQVINELKALTEEKAE